MEREVAPVFIGSGLIFAEGINFDRDGTLYCVDVPGGGIWRLPPGGALRRYSLNPARGYEELAPLATLSPARSGPDPAGPDGIAFGADGNLYVAHFNADVVRVIAPDGTFVASLPAGGPTPTNIAFWGDSLYVTEGTSGSIYRLDIGVREQPPFMRPW